MTEHLNQFAILRQELDLPGYQHFNLADGWILSVHKGMPVYQRDGIVLLGNAWQVLPGKKTPREELADLDLPAGQEEIYALEESWCGRYLLIVGHKIYMDAAGTLGVFYSDAGISSDCSLLAQTMGMAEKLYFCDRPMSWMPGPYTQYAGVRRLLPSQVYDFHTHEIESRPLLARQVEVFRDENRLIDRFSDLFCTSLQNLAAMFPQRKLMVALTGGADSRTVFALSLRAGLPVTAYTLGHDNIPEGDLEIPAVLCRRANVPHIFIERDKSKYDPALEDRYNRHIAGLVHDEDRLFYAHRQYQALEEMFGDVLLLRGSLWESFIDFFHRFFTDETANEEFFSAFDYPADCLEQRSLKAFLDWCYANPQPGIIMSDRMFWEQCGGCWLSAIEQGFDLLEHTLSIQPLNCRLLMTLLLQFPVEERSLKEHQHKITQKACPVIGDIAYSSKKRRGQSLPVILRTKAQKAVRRLKTNGFKKTVRTYGDIFSENIRMKKLKKKQEKKNKR